jgi:hypothetical protein
LEVPLARQRAGCPRWEETAAGDEHDVKLIRSLLPRRGHEG